MRVNKDIPSYEFVFPTNYTYKTCERKSANPPFRVRLQHLLDESDIGIEDVAAGDDLLDLPAWDTPPVECLTHLTFFPKEDTSPYLIKQEFKITEEKFCDYHPIYTDGSKQNEKLLVHLLQRMDLFPIVYLITQAFSQL